MRRNFHTFVALVGFATFWGTATAQAFPTERLTLDAGMGSALALHTSSYEVLSRTPSGGQNSTRVDHHFLASTVIVNVASTYRIGPTIGFGLDGFAAFDLNRSSHDWLEVAGIRFGRRSVYGISAVVDVSPQSRRFAERRGWLIRAGIGANWSDDAMKHGPDVLAVRRAVGGSGGRHIIGIFGYRWPMHDRFSLTLQVITVLQTMGIQQGLFVGGGFQ